MQAEPGREYAVQCTLACNFKIWLFVFLPVITVLLYCVQAELASARTHLAEAQEEISRMRARLMVDCYYYL
jgi:hypothetical protein